MKSGGVASRALGMALAVLVMAVVQLALPHAAAAQDRVLTAVVLVNSQNTAGYNTSTSSPGEYQRFAERYFEHLQVPYDLIDVATQSPPTLANRQLIIAAHSGLDLSAAWRNAIATAVQGGVGFVNLDSSASIGTQSHIQAIFAASGSSAGTPATTIRVPAAVQIGGAARHFIADLQRRFGNDPPGDIVYSFHRDSAGVQQTATSTVLTGASGTVIARLGNDPLIVATTYGSGRAVHFGTLEYLRADRFGFLRGVDDLFWRSLVWAARKPFVLRGYPRLWSVQMDDTLPGWGERVRDMYNPAFTGTTASDGTGGPWRVTGYVFTDNLPPGSPERASVINDINAGLLQISPHARGSSYGNLYWETTGGQPLNATTWLATIDALDSWLTGNGGADEIPFISRSIVPHYWNLSDITGSDLWNALGFRYMTEIQRPGVEFFGKTTPADRVPLRPFRIYEQPPAASPDENYPLYWADNYVVNSRPGLPPQTFFGFATQVIDLDRYDRQDVAWPNATRPISESIDHFQYYTWRLWSSLAPTQIYTHDGGGGGGNYVLSTPAERQEVIRAVSSWLNEERAQHRFMEEVGAYMSARTRSVLTDADVVGGNLIVTFSGNATTATELLYFGSDAEAIPVVVGTFSGGGTITVPVASLTGNPVPTTTGLSPSSAAAGGAGFTLIVNGTNFTPDSLVRWNGSGRATTYISPTEVRAVITAADVAVVGAATVTVVNPAPGGGISNAQTFTLTGNPLPTLTSLSPSTVVAGSGSFTLTVTGTGFVSGSVVRWNGADRTTTFVSSTQLTATIPAADITSIGSAGVAVFTPSPGGGTSNVQTVQIVGASSGTFVDDFNRADSAAIGNGWIEKTPAAFAIAANRVTKAGTATGFADNLVYRPGSEVMLDGEASIEVRFASSPPGYAQIFVRGQMGNIETAGQFTGYLLFIDNNATRAYLDRIENGAFVPLAQITLSQALNTTDTYRLRLRATGTNPVVVAAFVDWFSGSAWTTIGQAVVNDLAATRVQTPGTVGFTGYVEGGIYSYDNFTRTSFDGPAPVPTTTSIAPESAGAGSSSFTLIVNGTNFVPASVVRWNGASRTTTYVSGTQLTADITSADVASAGTATVTVFNPEPGGGTSNGQTFTITAPQNPIPGIGSLSPSSASVGGSQFTLTVNGSGFVSGSVVRWNGENRTTTYVSPTQLTATIPAADIASAGTATITVFNPSPGGGTSAAQSFPIVAPTFFDDFSRPDNAVLGNGWIEKTPSAFSIAGGRVAKVATTTVYADNLVYRPATDVMLNGEASVEVRFASTPPGYAQVFVRAQMATIANPGQFTGYLLFTDNNVGVAYLDRIENGAFVPLAQIAINPVLNTTDTYRLRLRATGTNPVALAAYIERQNGSGWDIIGQAFVNDTAATRVATAGTVGFTGDRENGVYSYDNFLRTSFDGTNPLPTTTGLAPNTASAGGAAFTLTVNGTNFVPGATVQWNGSPRTTTFVSPTRVTAAISAADIATVGTATVTVVNPTPGGGTSNGQTFTIAVPGNPQPVVTGLSPSSATVGGPGFTLTVNGSGFVNGSVVRWNGADRMTTYVSPTQLTAAITAADIASAGTASVTVFTPAPGGGTSDAQSFSIVSAVFFDDFARPDNAALGNGWIEKNAGAFSLVGGRVTKAATSSGFADNLVYRPAGEAMLDGEASVEVRFASMPPGYAQVFVRGQLANIGNPGQLTGYLLFVDSNASLAYLDRMENGSFVELASIPISPALNVTDTYRLRLRATGTNPVAVSAYVERLAAGTWNVIGQAGVNDTAATRVATAGTVGFTGHTEGGIYSYDNFTRTSFDGTNPVPTATSLSPASANAGGAAFTLTVDGTNFVPGATVRWNGTDRTTTFVSPTRLTAAIAAADIASVGTASVTVVNPGPGGGISNGLTFTINAAGNPVPVLTSISPSSASAGGPAFTLTVTGSDFVNGSVVRWNGADRMTTYVSPTQLTAAITAADIASAGTASVTVFTPAPGGGTSAAQSFSIAAGGGSFFDDFNRANNATIGNGWTEKYPNAFSITNNEVTHIDTTSVDIDYHDAIVYRPASEDRSDVEVSIEFRVLQSTLTFPQVHARIQRDTITQADTLNDYLFFVDGFEPLPGRAIIARQQAVPGQYECYMLGIPFPSALDPSARYRLRFRVTGASPVVLQGYVERFNGSGWDVFASGTVAHSATGQVPARDPELYCDPGFMPGPLTTAGAVGFAKWRTNNEVLDNFSWTDLSGMNGVPATFSLTPASTTAGSGGFTLTVTGANFVPGSVVRWNGSDRTTTFVSSTQLTATITAADVASAGTRSVTVFNPAPGGGLSNAQTFTVNASGNPVPVLTSLSPSSATAGGAGFTLIVNGSNFVNGSVVRWNGSNRTTTFVSSTELRATISAADIATAGTANVTVFTPTPGGGTSSPQTFAINPAGGSTTVNFDNPAPPGSPGSALSGTFQGIDFGTSQWAWDGPYGPNPTNHIFFNSSSGTSRTFTFTSPRILDGVTVYSLSTGTLTLSDNQGQVRTQTVNPGSLITVQTGWSTPSTTVTVNFTAGWDLGLDNIAYR
jgi:hypothetical protein